MLEPYMSTATPLTGWCHWLFCMKLYDEVGWYNWYRSYSSLNK
jgi:hypothetical protein